VSIWPHEANSTPGAILPSA